MTFTAQIQFRYIFFMIASMSIAGTLILLPFWQEYIVKSTSMIFSLIKDARVIGAFMTAAALIFMIALFGYVRFKKKYFYWINYFILILMLSVSVSFAAQKILKSYQIMRLVVFINPEVDSQGAGWNIIQSTNAIGSGGFLGKGFLQGTQSHLRYIPQQSTALIFSIFSEELGFLGGVLLFLIFFIIIIRLIKIMKNAQDPFGAYISAGVCAMFVFHFIINIGMTMGIMPITGIPLLFMSYGGSALISAMCGIGLALSVYTRRFQY